MRSVTVRLEDLRTTILNLGFVGENEHRQIRIDSKKFYDEYPQAAASLTVSPPCGEPYPAVIERDGDFVIWTITDSDVISEGDGEIQLSFSQEPHVGKTYVCRTRTGRSLVPTGDIPEGIDDFITRAGAALTAIPETIGREIGEAMAENLETMEGLKSAAQEAKEGAEDAQTGAEAAQRAAESAQAGAETASGAAEAAQTAAESAQTGAESAKADAESAAQSAGASAQSAEASSQLAAGSASAAGTSASNASGYAAAAAASAQSAAAQVQLVEAAGTAQIALVAAEGTAQAAAVEAKGEEVLESIPSDYSTLSGEVSQLKNDLNDMGFILTPETTDGYRINVNDGQAYAESTVQGLSVTGYIPVRPSTKIIVKNALLKGQRGICAYNEDKSYNSGLASDMGDDPVTVEVTIPSNAYYIRATIKGTPEIMYDNSGKFFDMVGIINGINADISLITDGFNLTADDFIVGYIGSNGQYYDTYTNSNAVTRMIAKTEFDGISIYADSGYQFNICTYNGDTFVERSSWYKSTDGIIKTGNTYGVKINIATVSSGTSESIATVLSHVHVVFDSKDIPTVMRKSVSTKKFEFLNKIGTTWTGSRIAHYSVDDVYAVLKDLTTNAETYTSIYDNTMLATLKNIHDSTGMCVTLNTFNTHDDDPTYSISNVPSKTAFQTEFQSAKNWLKFAFHSGGSTDNYDEDSGISAAYDTFVSAIYTLTGDYDCIDRFTRLGYFGGTLENVLLIKNKTHGITGLLCADTTNRSSYYLSADQNAQVQSKGMVVDADNELIFLKTITRSLGTNAQNEIKNNLCYQKYVEIFSHEYESSWLTSCQSMCEWLKDEGYVFAFPSLIFDVGQ